jgi:7-cyano-7-deazaguanine synthase
MNRSTKPKSVVLLSGGMDSAVCAALAVRDSHPAALHVNYGQRTEARELRAFHAVCDRLNIAQRLVVENPFFRQIGGSALTDSAMAVPEARPQMGRDIPVTYVPFRNAHLLSAAVSWAEVLAASQIYIGAVEQDSSGYPDCRQEFYAAFSEAIRVGTKAGAEGARLEIITPLIALKKSEIVRLGVEVSAPFDLTWSCYSGQDEACGVCESCVLRLRAFAEAGVADPVRYAAQAVHS